MLDSFLRGDHALAPTPLGTIALALLLAFALGQLLAWVYMATHDSLSYSRAFVVSLLLLPVIVALVMLVLAHNLVAAFGLMAVFAIVRFRNVLRDTLDTAHVLAGLVAGMACGTQKFATAVLGGFIIAAIMAYARFVHFGSRWRYDFILRLRWTRSATELNELDRLLARHGRRVRLARRRAAVESGGSDLSYHLLLRDPARAAELLSELGALTGVADLHGIEAAEETEV
jgi:hypothetical protein